LEKVLDGPEDLIGCMIWNILSDYRNQANILNKP
jgi:hypothetical protein